MINYKNTILGAAKKGSSFNFTPYEKAPERK